jgi:hypothetical protein
LKFSSLSRVLEVEITKGAMIELATLSAEDNSLSYETLYEEDALDSNLWVFWLKAIDHDGDGDLDILSDKQIAGTSSRTV